MAGSKSPINADRGMAWIAEGARAARVGEPVEANPYQGREEQVPRLLWLRGYTRGRFQDSGSLSELSRYRGRGDAEAS